MTLAWHQEAELQRLRAVASEHHSMMHEIWAARFSVTSGLEVRQLKKAHRYVLAELSKAWDNGRFAEGLDNRAASLRHLPADLLAKVIKATTHGQGALVSEIHAAVCCVCRVFEAIAYDVVSAASLYDDPDFEQQGQQFPLLALSANLTVLKLVGRYDEGEEDVPDAFPPVAAVALPAYAQLTRLELIYVSQDTVVLAALCEGLVALTLHAFGVGECLPAVLRSLPKLERLGLAMLDLTEDTLPALRAASTVTRLGLESVNTPFSWLELAFLPHLRELVVDEVPWVECDMEKLPREPRLERLVLVYGVYGNGRSPVGGDNEKAVAGLLLRFTRLQSLRLCVPWLAANVEALSDALQHLPKLTRLQIPYTDCEPTHVALFRCLPRFSALRTLDLAVWDVGDPQLCAVLQQCTALSELVVHFSTSAAHDHSLKPEAVSFLLQSCKHLRCVTTFASRGPVANQFAVACCQAAVDHPSLTDLSFWGEFAAPARNECAVVCKNRVNLSWPEETVWGEDDYGVNGRVFLI